MIKIESEIAKLEKHLKTKLPYSFKKYLTNLESDYLDYIAKYGSEDINIRKDIYLSKVKPHPYGTKYSKDDFGCLPISYLFTLIDNTQNNLTDIYCSLYKKVFKTDDWLPFADDGGGGYICIGIKDNNIGKVSYLNYDIEIIADSLDEFLEICRQ